MTMVDYQQEHQPEKAFLVAVHVRQTDPLLSLEDSLRELALLCDTAGIEVLGSTTQTLNRIDPATFAGSGKVEEIRDAVEQLGAQVVVFDDELSPRHQRELEKRLGENIRILDRSALILDIFAQHARTREGALQVELAQYEYRLPRLTRMWTHLARQAGGASRGGVSGVGLRGPGETQLEVDRREIRRRIAKLQDELERVRKHREQHRVQRRKSGVPVIALVGYTNAGKSTLLNAISGADVYVADQLFATLDPTMRRVDLPSGRQVVFSDTVGFIQKLPTTLVAAFRATLEEIAEADLILHVVDVSHPNALAHLEAVEDTLAEIDVADIPRILVWNKADQHHAAPLPQPPDADDYVAQVTVSALKKTGLDELLQAVDRYLSSHLHAVSLLIPYDRGDLVEQLHVEARVIKQDHSDEGFVIAVYLPVSLQEKFEPYLNH